MGQKLQDPRRRRRRRGPSRPRPLPSREGLRGRRRGTLREAEAVATTAGRPRDRRPASARRHRDRAPAAAALRLPHLPVVMLTAHGTIDMAVQAVRRRRSVPDQTRRPRRAGSDPGPRARGPQESPEAARSALPAGSPHALPGHERCDTSARRRGAAGARDDRPVLIRGETGSGKGVLARWLHDPAARREAFVDLNCAGMSRDLLDAELFGHEAGAFTGAVKARAGLLEVAHRGTVFLDEVGDMDVAIQARLLKVLEEKRFRRPRRHARPLRRHPADRGHAP